MADNNEPSTFTKVTTSIMIVMSLCGGIVKSYDVWNDHLTDCDKWAGDLYDETKQGTTSDYALFLKYRNRDKICESWTLDDITELAHKNTDNAKRK